MRGGGRQLRDGGQDQRCPEQRPDTELVDQHSSGQGEERGHDRAHREERADLKPACSEIVRVERYRESARADGAKNCTGGDVQGKRAAR